ncbi:MAG: phosphopantetheine-binding protein [Methylotenera sp.]
MSTQTYSLDEVKQVLTGLIADKIDVDRSTIKPDSNLKELGLDSLDTFDLIFSAEDYFKIKVPSDQIKIETLEDVSVLLHRLIVSSN